MRRVLGLLVDDAHVDTLLAQAQSSDQPDRTGTDHEDLRAHWL
jgi:hypothetical protein